MKQEDAGLDDSPDLRLVEGYAACQGPRGWT